ncbi:cysteine three histidine 1 [Megalops cyprinoides]|uniref:cysteine three histidine 1 n=1 Tax=Megalops cyprinoides TaxID=118141 RepID=UPI001864251E|nr:cysteine three histidine 1 [Megalops cyprinoides]
MFEYEPCADLLLYPFLDEEEGDKEPLFPGEGSGSGGLSLAEALLPLVESPPSTPPPPTPWMCYARYKTELCSRYTELGSCKYAERCQFAHGLRDLRVPSRHPKYKTELCRAFHTVGYCAYGARCLFVHAPKEQRPARPPRNRNVPCRTFRSFGVCPFGERCHFLHVEGGGSDSGAEAVGVAEEDGGEARTQSRERRPRGGALCRTFSAFGFCLYGTRCRFQHCLPSASGQAREGGLGVPPALPLLSGTGRALSPASDMLSSSSTSSSSSPPSSLPSPVFLEDASPFTPPLLSGDSSEQDAFAFPSQQLNDLLLPLAWRLQQLENSLARPASSPVVGDKPL